MQDYHGLEAESDLYEQIRDGFKTPSYTERIGEEMKIEEIEIVGKEKVHIITRVTTIDYQLYRLSHYQKPNSEKDG